MQTWILDNYVIFSLVVAIFAAFIVIWLNVYALRIAEKSSFKSKIATVVASLVVGVLFTVPLNHIIAQGRDRENRKLTLRHDHLLRLQQTLKKDSKVISEIARRVEADGRVTDISKDTPANERELEALFAPDVLSLDLANHLTEYWEQRQRLRSDIGIQDREFRDFLELLTKGVDISPIGEIRRLEVARSILGKCLEKMPGITLTLSDDGYTYSALGGSQVSSGGGGRNYLPRPSADLVAAFEAFNKFQLSPEAITECDTLKSRAKHIHEKAITLSSQAEAFAEQTTLFGDCKYTRLE